MDTHRVEIFNRTDNHNIVSEITHDLELELFPADHRFFDKDFTGRRRIYAGNRHVFVFFRVIGNPSTGPTKGE